MPRQSSTIHESNSWTEQIAARRRFYISKYPQKQDIPFKVVHGLVRGLILYYSRPARRRNADGIHLDRLEEALLAWIEGIATRKATGNKRWYDNDSITSFANTIPEIMTVLLQHPSPIILQHQVKWLVQELKKYSSILKAHEMNSERDRNKWVQKHLPRILDKLLLVSRCPQINCPRATNVPAPETLKEWTYKSGVKGLCFHILAHFHGSTFRTVQRRFRSPSSR